MVSIGQQLASRATTDTTDTTVFNLLNTTDTTDTVGKDYAVDLLFKDLSDLTNPQFRAWYCSSFYKLGRDIVLRVASTARQEAKSDKRRYFSFLLKQELKKV